MPEISLYKICLERVYSLLKVETWKHCSVNPFSNLPSKIVDDLMEFPEYDYVPISLISPVLTSGSLTRLQLHGDTVQNERDLFLLIIRTNCVKFLRFLSWNSINDCLIPLVETLIRSLPKLEVFEACQIINLDAFQNCKELRVLEIYEIYSTCDNYSRMNFSALASLRNLQKVRFAFFEIDTSAKVLKHCPQLISLGCNDSLEGLEKIHAKIKRRCETDYSQVPEKFQLKRCVWGKPRCDLISSAINAKLYKSSFPEKVRIAVFLCPFIENLEIRVSHTDSIEYLKNLKKLVSLNISFFGCDSDSDYMVNFIALLKVIGSNLKHLTVKGRHPVPVDIVCDCCPRLEIFQIKHLATASMSVQPLCNLFLKRLHIEMIDQNALLFLLSSCKGMVELSIDDALCLDDNVLSEILAKNPLAQLKGCDITKCNLSKKGFRMILQKILSLEKVNFSASPKDTTSVVVKKLINELNLTNVIYDEDYRGCGGFFDELFL